MEEGYHRSEQSKHRGMQQGGIYMHAGRMKVWIQCEGGD